MRRNIDLLLEVLCKNFSDLYDADFQNDSYGGSDYYGSVAIPIPSRSDVHIYNNLNTTQY